MEFGLQNKVALITGANNPQGIGAATALAFAREGAKIVLMYKKIRHEYDESKIDRYGVDRYFKANSGDTSEVEEKLRLIDADYLVIESDISDEENVKGIFDQAIERFGKVDILVNNSAVSDGDGNDAIETLTQSVIDNTFSVNVKGTITMIREFVKRHGEYGRIINLSTDAARFSLDRLLMGQAKQL